MGFAVTVSHSTAPMAATLLSEKFRFARLTMKLVNQTFERVDARHVILARRNKITAKLSNAAFAFSESFGDGLSK